MKSLENNRHSLAHLLAAAVMDLWPDTKRTIGPAIDNGFYFDFQFSKPISDSDLPKIEKKMRQILPTWDKFEKHELSAAEAKKEYPDNLFKHELIDEFAKDSGKLSFYKSGDYWDLCKGGHVESMKEVKPDSFKLSHIAGAYWRGDEKNPMLTRVYGLAFASKQELEEHLKMLEEAKKRDHKKLGVDLDLFTFSNLVGAGLPLWTPKGTILRDLLDDYVWHLRQIRGYQKVEIPHITKKDLYEKSGHWDKFKDELMRINTREGHEFAMKPMNCPHHIQIFTRKPHSYREMPQRYASTTMVYRDEQTGELSGLSRVRSITQDDAHVFARHNQIKDEILKVWEIVDEFYSAFGFPMEIRLSLHDPEQKDKYLGDAKIWNEAEDTLRAIAKQKKVKPIEGIGEAAFYGPKIDFMAKDSLGRQWQVATIQLDFNQPERFDLACANEKGEKERIAMIHAAVMGAIERFISIIIEHFAGAFPLWLSPVQVAILPINDEVVEYSEKIAAELRTAGLRIELDSRNESIGKKIREAEKQKIPYMLIIGKKEMEAETISVRGRGEKDLGSMSLDKFIEKIQKEISEKQIQ
ncbi:MAG: threonine--tRNA ligase [Candidatus Doudnabacteria bacterium RIFCSPHIGHO2_01_FULL_46_14]|uniref:Threonine--tRNA ligase n=1 Tax=Candidatus Doudnabacteria bacterium RIFCSPHIGHO2_01_FULL_46_14 TaxID=1817824 RepID=A0A1F5NN49_9BACT|nr:MAG: threonine--tRNA ligase [Candidatus Doudnabacteria bacterium RIFCSPHIGHO2_01_FULL_46_14]